ncbi:MAG: DUF6240 domain-containing protein, partial [Clostridiales bacterium]|nr:DUF6240 domain-containing protein [Clostridiales bacterium]
MRQATTVSNEYKRTTVGDLPAKTAKPALKKGNVLSAIITQKGEQSTTLITERDEVLNVKSGEIKGREGDRIFLEVMKDGGQFVMRQVFPEGEQKTFRNVMKKAETESLKDLVEELGYAEPESVKTLKDAFAEDKIRTSQLEAKIRRDMSGAINNTTGTAIALLAAEGVSVSKIPLSVLNEVVSDIEANPFIIAEEKKPQLSGKIESALQRAGIPPNASNVKSLQTVLQKFSAAKTLSDVEISFAVASNKAPTLENAYAAKFSGAKQSTEQNPESFAAEIKDFFSRRNIADTRQNMNAAQSLLQNNVDISEETLLKFKVFKNIEAFSETRLLDSAAALIKAGKKASEILLDARFSATDETEQVQEIPKEVAETPEMRVPEIKTPHVATRTEAVSESERKLAEEYREFLKDLPRLAENTARTPYANKRTILEIAVRLTYESASVLVGKNIKIDVMPLDNALSEVIKAENEVFAKRLGYAGVDASDSNISAMERIVTETKMLTYSQPSFYKEVLSGEAVLSLKHMSKAARNDFFGEFAEIQTAPNALRGDSFAKAEGLFAPVLESLGYDTAPETIRAAQILSMNNIDITEEALRKVKLADAKVNRLYRKLTPAVAAQMIADGFDGYTAPIDDVLEYIDKFADKYGENSFETLAKNIYIAEKSGVISEENRKHIMEFYGVLNAVLKNKGSVGATVGAGKTLTVAHLYEAAKFAGKHTDIKSEGIEYLNMAVKRLAEAAHPQALDKVLANNSNADFMNMSVEELTEQLENFTGNLSSTAYKNPFEDLQGVPAGAVLIMQRAGITVSANNIITLKRLLKNNSFGAETIAELAENSESVKEAFESF